MNFVPEDYPHLQWARDLYEEVKDSGRARWGGERTGMLRHADGNRPHPVVRDRLQAGGAAGRSTTGLRSCRAGHPPPPTSPRQVLTAPGPVPPHYRGTVITRGRRGPWPIISAAT